jgi:hypothetical protein
LSGAPSYLSAVVCYSSSAFGCRVLTVNCRWILLFFGFRVSLSGVGCWLLIVSFECGLLIVGCLFRRILLFHGFQVSLSCVFVGGFSRFMVFECRCRASLSADFSVSWFSRVVVGCWLLIIGVGVGKGAFSAVFFRSFFYACRSCKVAYCTVLEF